MAYCSNKISLRNAAPRPGGAQGSAGATRALGIFRRGAVCALVLALGWAGFAPDARSQDAPSSSAGVPVQSAPPPTDSNVVIDESFSIRLDEDLVQLEEAVGLIAGSLARVTDRVNSLAINSFYFGREVDADFRRKAEVVILDKVFVFNPNIKLVQCQECQKLETKIVRGILKLRKGIPTSEERIRLAEKLQVDGFIDIGMFRNDGQLTVYIKVTEAKSGAIIMVDELAGRKAFRRRSLTFSFGELTIPITIADEWVSHKALLISVQESVKLTKRFSFGVDLIFYKDKNDSNPDPHIKLKTSVMLIPTLGLDILQMPSSTTRVMFFVGVGKLLSKQLDYANLYRAGLEFVVGDSMSILVATNRYTESIVDTSSAGGVITDKMSGGGYELRFGYRF